MLEINYKGGWKLWKIHWNWENMAINLGMVKLLLHSRAPAWIRSSTLNPLKSRAVCSLQGEVRRKVWYSIGSSKLFAILVTILQPVLYSKCLIWIKFANKWKPQTFSGMAVWMGSRLNMLYPFCCLKMRSYLLGKSILLTSCWHRQNDWSFPLYLFLPALLHWAMQGDLLCLNRAHFCGCWKICSPLNATDSWFNVFQRRIGITSEPEIRWTCRYWSLYLCLSVKAII